MSRVLIARVPVPRELRLALADIVATKSARTVASELGLCRTALEDALSVNGCVSARMLERLRTVVAEHRGAA